MSVCGEFLRGKAPRRNRNPSGDARNPLHLWRGGCQYVWFKKVDAYGIKTNVALINRYIEEDLSVYSLVLQLDEHFKRIETHNP